MSRHLQLLSNDPSKGKVQKKKSKKKLTNVSFAFTHTYTTVPQSQGDPKIVKRGPNFWQKGDPKGTLFDVKGDLKFEFFRIVHKERIC